MSSYFKSVGYPMCGMHILQCTHVQIQRVVYLGGKLLWFVQIRRLFCTEIIFMIQEFIYEII